MSPRVNHIFIAREVRHQVLPRAKIQRQHFDFVLGAVREVERVAAEQAGDRPEHLLRVQGFVLGLGQVGMYGEHADLPAVDEVHVAVRVAVLDDVVAVEIDFAPQSRRYLGQQRVVDVLLVDWILLKCMHLPIKFCEVEF